MTYQFEKSGKLKPLTQEELDELNEGNSAIIACGHGTGDDGKPYWFFIAVKPSKYEEFMLLMAKRAHITFADYGEIRKYGIGETVPNAVKQEMKELYGWDDNYVKNVEQDVEKARTEFLKEEGTKDTTRFNDLAAMLKHKQSQS